MSFGEGNLHEEVDRLKGVNGELCAEINRQERRIRELENELNDVAGKWAAAQVKAEDASRRCMLLEALVRDWQELYEYPDYGDCCRLMKRMREFGIEVPE